MVDVLPAGVRHRGAPDDVVERIGMIGRGRPELAVGPVTVGRTRRGSQMLGEHRYQVTVEWTGNRGEGTSGYRNYDRDHDVRAEHATTIAGSSDPHFRGNPSRWNPELLLVASVSQCHMLSYLHHATSNGVVVTAYIDHPIGVMTEDGAGGGAFTELTLHPVVTVADESMVETAERIHADANRTCFIAQTLAIPVQHDATTLVAVNR